MTKITVFPFVRLTVFFETLKFVKIWFYQLKCILFMKECNSHSFQPLRGILKFPKLTKLIAFTPRYQPYWNLEILLSREKMRKLRFFVLGFLVTDFILKNWRKLRFSSLPILLNIWIFLKFWKIDENYDSSIASAS